MPDFTTDNLSQYKKEDLSQRFNFYKTIYGRMIAPEQKVSPQEKLKEAVLEKLPKITSPKQQPVGFGGAQSVGVGAPSVGIGEFKDVGTIPEIKLEDILKPDIKEEIKYPDDVEKVNNFYQQSDNLKQTIDELLSRKEQLKSAKEDVLSEQTYNTIQQAIKNAGAIKQEFDINRAAYALDLLINNPEKFFEEAVSQTKEGIEALATKTSAVSEAVLTGVTKQLTFGLMDKYLKEEPEGIGVSKKTFKAVSTGSELATFAAEYALASRLLGAGAGAVLGRFAPSSVINLALKYPNYFKKIIDLSVWVGLDVLNADNFTLTDEEKSKGITLSKKLGEKALWSSALWGGFELVNLGLGKFSKVVLPVLINSVVKPTIKTTGEVINSLVFKPLEKAFKLADKFSSKVNDKLNEKAAEKIATEITALKSVIEKPEEKAVAKGVETELKPLAEEARKYKSAEEFVMRGLKPFHAVKFEDLYLIKEANNKIVAPSFGVAKNFEQAKEFGDIIFVPSEKMLNEARFFTRDIWSPILRQLPDKLYIPNKKSPIYKEVSQIVKREGFNLDEIVNEAISTNDPFRQLGLYLQNSQEMMDSLRQIATKYGLKARPDEYGEIDYTNRIISELLKRVDKTPENISRFLKAAYGKEKIRGVEALFGGAQTAAKEFKYKDLNKFIHMLSEEKLDSIKFFEKQQEARDFVAKLLKRDYLSFTDESAGYLAQFDKFGKFKHSLIEDFGVDITKIPETELKKGYEMLRKSYVEIPSEYFEGKSFEAYDINEFPAVITDNKLAVAKLKQMGYKGKIFQNLTDFYNQAVKEVKEIKPELKPLAKEIQPEVNLGKVSQLEKLADKIKENISIKDKFNVDNWINTVEKRNVVSGKELKRSFGGESLSEVERYFEPYLGKERTVKEFLSEIYEGIPEGEKVTGWRFVTSKSKKPLKPVDYSELLKQSILRADARTMTEADIQAVLNRYKPHLEKLGQYIKEGNPIEEFVDIAKLTDEDKALLRTVAERFKNTAGTEKDFISAIVGKDVSGMSSKELMPYIKQASGFAARFQYRSYKEMYADLLKSNPQLINELGYTVSKGKVKFDLKPETTAAKLETIKEGINTIKNKDIFSYIKQNIENNLDYTYFNMVADFASAQYGMSKDEINKMIDTPEWRKLLERVDADFKKKYKRPSVKMFDRWIKEGSGKLDEVAEEELIQKATISSITSEKSITPSLDNVIAKHSVESNAELAKELQKGFINFGKIENENDLKIFNEKVNEKFKNVKETDKNIFDSLKESIRNLKQWLRKLGGEFETDPTLNKYFPNYINDKIILRSKALSANTDAALAVSNIVRTLSRPEKELFRRIIVLSNSFVDSFQLKRTPFDDVLTPEELENTLTAAFELAKNKYPKVIDALRRHAEIVRSIREDYLRLKNIDLSFIDSLEKEKYDLLKNKFVKWSGISNILPEDLYFHHEVVDFASSFSGSAAFVPKELKKPFNIYTIRRKGTTRDINTDYEKVMMDYIARAKFYLELEKFGQDTLSKYHIANFVPDINLLDERLINNEFKNGAIVPDDLIPQVVKEKYPDVRWRAYQFDKGKYIFKAKNINESILFNALETEKTVEEWLSMVGKRGGKPISEVLALGKNKDVYILPEQIYYDLHNLKTGSPQINALLRPFTAFNSFFKPLATKWYGGFAWRTMNTVGDLLTLFFLQPEAYKQILKAVNLAYQYAFKYPEQYDKAAQEFYNKLRENAVLSSAFGAYKSYEIGGGLRLERALDVLKTYSNTFDRFSGFLESLPKIASILENLNRIEKGKPIKVFAGEEYIKRLVELGYAEEAAFAYGRFVTVDYAAMPDAFRQLFTDALAPFSFWFARTSQIYLRAFKEKPVYSFLQYSIPIAAIYAWNNLPQNKKLYDMLPDSQKVGLTMVLGYNEKENKVITLRLLRPVDIVTQIFGVDKLPPLLERVFKGEMEPKEAAVQLLTSSMTAPFRFIAGRLANPIISVMFAVATNKDIYTGKPIISDEEKGTPTAITRLIDYFAQKLLPPIYQMYQTDLQTDIEEHPLEWALSVLGRPIDVPGQFVQKSLIMQNIFNNLREDKDLLESRRNKFKLQLQQAILDADADKVNEILQTIPDKYPYIDVNDLVKSVISSSTFLEEIIRKLSKQSDNPQVKSLLQNIINLLKLNNLWEGTPKTLRTELLNLTF